MENITLYLDRVRHAIGKFGSNTALCYKGRTYTYDELDSVTGRLAARLKEEGIGAGDIVSVLISRNEYLTLAPLGILRAGAAYQPLDPAHPTARIKAMIENAKSPLVIVEKACEHLLEGVSFGKDRKKLYLEDIPFLPSQEKALWGNVRPDDDFVILYTSGSTGVPKGIEITHRNIASLLDWYIDYYSVDETCRVGQHSSFVFDPAIVEAMLPLAAGASIHIIPQEIRADVFQLDRFYEKNRITYASLTTQLGRQFVLHGKGRTLQHLVVGGEALISVAPPKHYTLHNGYGPAEGTQLITVFSVQKEYPQMVPIGKALPEVEIYLLDEKGNPVKDGEAGELCFAGPHVTKGYLNRPDMTEKVFTDNPFSDKPGYQRMYHTGDLARKGEDGNFEYLGRKDRQVKIRGFRIEPSEIEALLDTFEGIDDVVVVPRSMGSEKMLVAYYLSKEPKDKRLLSDFVLAHKPSYMLPAFFIHMDAFPMTVNGKVDYDALPKPARKTGDDFEAPVSRTEKALAALYEEILGMEPVGRQDNFLQLGGTSLSSAMLLYRIYDAFSCRIGIRDIMEAPVLWELAGRIDQKRSIADDGAVIFEQKMLPLRGEYEASYAQERMYTAQEMLGVDDPTYLLRMYIRTEGIFDRTKTEETLRALFLRHDSLRTEFHMTENGLMQKVLPSTEEWVREAVARTEGKELFPSFSMEEAPLFAWRFSSQELSFQWHHSISDGRSSILFAKEFCKLYNGKTLPALPVHQKEYAAYERKFMQSALYRQRMTEWQQEFAPFTEAEELRLPFDGRLNTGTEQKAGHVKTVLPKLLSEQIRQFCHGKQMTPYMFLLAVYAILLHQYSRADSMILGTVMDGREEPGTKDLQGMFVNTVPLFLSAEDDSSLSDFYGQVTQTALFGMEHQSVPLEEIAGAFESAGGFARTAHGHLLFDYLFVMQSFDRQVDDIDGHHIEIGFGDGDRAMYDLSLEMEEGQDGFHCDFEYARELFAEDTIRWMAHHYEVLIGACLQEKAATVSTLSMLDEEETHKLLYDFRGEVFDTQVQVQTVVGLLEQRVREQPHKTAVVFREEALSYAALWQSSGVLAGALLAAIGTEGEDAAGTFHATAEMDSRDDFGRKKERRVAIFAERGLSMITAIWGVLRANCAYVPVSPSYPIERIRYLLEDCDAACVIECDAALPDSMREWISEKGIACISCDASDGSKKDLPEPRLDAAAYMIYTSGTTGEPKGVVVEHRQLSALLTAYADIYKLSSEDTVLQFAEFVFDQSVWDIFHILTVGGTLCLVPPEYVRNPDALSEYCLKYQVTAASLTPGFLRLLEPERFPTIRLLDVGGEAPDRELLLAWSKGRTVFNTYGPTETTVNATSFLFSEDGKLTECRNIPEGLLQKDTVPIGRAIPQTRIYIVKDNRLCGIGVPGELCIAGAQVARGYYRRPELTAEKFVPDPFFDGRMYRSGDLARYLPDGNIEFLGRIDDQVKLRGFRIELGEIGAAMRQIPGVKDAVAVISDSDGNEKVLCGYYTADDPENPVSSEELRRVLEIRLPFYMVPAFLLPLQEFPLTINGKLNKRALPKPQSSGQGAFVKAKTEAERDLAEAFCAVLGLDAVSVTADFLALGGDSIKAIRIVSMLRKKGYHLDAGLLMHSRTIRQLASLAKKAGKIVYEEVSHVRFTPVMKIFHASAMPNPAWYNQSVMLLVESRTKQDGLEAEAKNALRQLISLHGMLRLIVRGGELVVRDISEMPDVSLPVYENCSEKEREEICTHLQAQMAPDSGIVMQTALFEDNEECRLFLAFHHYVIDEVSWGILLGDLDRLLDHEIEFEKTVSFGEWSKKLWAYRDSSDFLPEKAYWEKCHQALEHHQETKPDWLSSYMTSEKNGFASFETALPVEISQKLSAIAKSKYHAKMDAFLLAALVFTLKETDGITALSAQMESHGRGALPGGIQSDRTVGWFTAVYPVLLAAAESFDEQVVLVRECLSGVPNAGIGYGLLYDDLSEKGGLVFNYLGDRQNDRYKNFKLTEESSGEEIDAQNGDPRTISVNIRQDEDGLFIDCAYDTVFEAAKVKRLLDAFQNKLTELAVMTDDHKRIYGPTDFCLDYGMPLSDWQRLTRKYPPERISAIARLTPLQQGMLYRYVAEPESRAYFLQDKLTICGKLWQDKLQAALKLVSMRYDALRLAFIYEDLEEPRQVILQERTPEFVDASDKDFSDAAEADSRRGFALADDSLMRITLCKSGEDAAELLVSMHHMIIDGWSFPIVIRDLMRYYTALCNGTDGRTLADAVSREAEEGCSFADYLRLYGRRNREKMLLGWEDYLRGAEEGTAPTVFADREGQEHGSQTERFLISGGLERQIRAYAARNHITCASFFGVLWGILLGFEGGVDTVLFGETVSGRNIELESMESAVGMFIHTIPVCVRLNQKTTVKQLMLQRQEDYLSMQPYEAADLSEIGVRTGLGAALVQSLYVYENYPAEDGDDGYHIEGIHEEVDYSITFCVEESDGFSLTLLFDRGQYPRSYARQLLKRLVYLADQCLADESIDIASLERTTPGERTQLLGDIAGIKRDFPQKAFPELFYGQVKRNPDKAALLLNGRSMSYGEVWRAACSLARTIGCGGERFVAVMADRSFELVISLIGTMLAGACYVPLDPEYPEERIRYILKDSSPEAVLYYVKEERAQALAVFAELDIPVISVPIAGEAGDTGIAAPGSGTFADGMDSEEAKDTCGSFRGMGLWDRLAYMIYTSGTTGMPKGVEIEHKALADMIFAHEERFGSLVDDTVLLMSNFVFDASVQQIFTPLAQGGMVCIMTKERMGSSKEIGDYCKDHKVSFIGATNALLRTLDPLDFDGIRVMSIGGDEADPALFEKWAAHTTLLVNDYGPTETTLHAVSHIYETGESKPVPIGVPYINKRICIMQQSRLCGIGQQGELCIGGNGLARGYHNQTKLTEEHFQPDPFSDGRIYRTGDLAVFGPDGRIFFRGRKDSQVKIRGFRIEPGEIDSAIMGFPGIKESATVSRKEDGREAYLVSYVTGEADMETGALLEYLRKQLPAYMVPTSIIRLEEIPLNFSGKVDVGRLPAPEFLADEVYEKPENETEERIAGLFARLLGAGKVGRNDSFLDLGGTSLDLMRLLSVLNHPKLRIADLVSHPTPKRLGAFLINQYREAEGCLLLQNGAADAPQIFCVPPSGGMAMCYMGLFRTLEYPGRIFGLADEKFQRFGALSLEELEKYDILRQDLWDANLDHYMEAIAPFFQAGDILVGYSQGGTAAHALAQRLEALGKPPGRLLMLEAMPFCEEELPYYKPENETERLAVVEAIFFGQRKAAEVEDRNGLSVRECLLRMLRKHGETADDAILHALYETYLVYSINTAHPLVTKGRINARIDSVLLPEEEQAGTAEIFPNEWDPWEDYTENKGEAFLLGKNGKEHLVFLTNYKKTLAKQLWKWIGDQL